MWGCRFHLIGVVVWIPGEAMKSELAVSLVLLCVVAAPWTGKLLEKEVFEEL